MSHRYQLLNTTKKVAPKNTREEVGFVVGVRYVSAGAQMEKDLLPGQSVITDVITDGHLKQWKVGNLAIKPLEDISVLLKQHAGSPKKASRSRVTTEEQSNQEIRQAMKADQQKKNRSRKKSGGAKLMGAKEDGKTSESTGDNFTVVADSNGKNKDESAKFTAQAKQS